MIITDPAKARIRKIHSDNPDKVFRAFLQGGGCVGFKYSFILDEANEDDTVFDVGDGALVVVDPMSYMYLQNAELDFKKELMGESFIIHNPDVATTCGCGASIGF